MHLPLPLGTRVTIFRYWVFVQALLPNIALGQAVKKDVLTFCHTLESALERVDIFEISKDEAEPFKEMLRVTKGLRGIADPRCDLEAVEERALFASTWVGNSTGCSDVVAHYRSLFAAMQLCDYYL